MFFAKKRLILTLLTLLTAVVALADSSSEIQFIETLNEEPNGIEVLTTLPEELVSRAEGAAFFNVNSDQGEKSTYLSPADVYQQNSPVAVVEFKTVYKVFVYKGKKYAVDVQVPTGIKIEKSSDLDSESEVLIKKSDSPMGYLIWE
ncbi:MAG: hypothetical protein KDD40_05765 [Bdellovibrionales bacterium]|nr:hypothetical protein [Bdellovibrionales bacterium]